MRTASVSACVCLHLRISAIHLAACTQSIQGCFLLCRRHLARTRPAEMARRSRRNVDMGLPWAAAATPSVTSRSTLPGAHSLTATSSAALPSTSTTPAVDPAARPAAAPASETQTESQILNWVSDPLDLTVSPHGEEVSLHHVSPHGEEVSPHHLSRVEMRPLLVPQDGQGGVVDGAAGAPSASGIARVGGGAGGMGGGRGEGRDRGKGKASGSARGLRHGHGTPHTMHRTLVSHGKLDCVPNSSWLEDSCLDEHMEHGAASGSRGTRATPSAVAAAGGGGASAARDGASVAGAYSGAAGGSKAVARGAKLIGDGASGASGADSGAASGRVRSTSVAAGVEGLAQSTYPGGTPGSGAGASLSCPGYDADTGSAFSNGIVSRTTPSGDRASGPLCVAAAPHSSLLEPAGPARRQSTRGRAATRLNHVAAHRAGASVQDTSCSAVGGTGQVLDGFCQREEECTLQRFQRLFPARISARLVAHTVGRRASESALSSSIIHMYHGLLGERQELAARAGTEAATGMASAQGGGNRDNSECQLWPPSNMQGADYAPFPMWPWTGTPTSAPGSRHPPPLVVSLV